MATPPVARLAPSAVQSLGIAELPDNFARGKVLSSAASVATSKSDEYASSVNANGNFGLHKGVDLKEASALDSDSDDQIEGGTKVPTTSARRQAQNIKFSAYLSCRAADITKKEIQAITKQVDEETLTIRAMMTRQESHKIIDEPREYQMELFERAKKKNIIAVLDTGSGKTLIAVLLLKHMIDQELEDRASGKRPRIAFFLVDCVTLVFQQFAVLECNLDQKVDRFCGEMGCDMWSKETWQNIFRENKVIVCTAEILYQCLMRAFLAMDDIMLLIFDEAHHTKKNHAYARIIKDCYMSQDPTRRPKIFGMTASPVDAREDPVKAAKELETLLHCQIATASDLSLLKNSISRPRELVATYASLCPTYDTPLSAKMHQEFGTLKELSKLFVTAREATRELGEWCADQLWKFAFVEEAANKIERKTERTFLADKENRQMAVLDAELARIQEAKDVVAKWQFRSPTFQGNSLSPKVVELLRRLLEEMPVNEDSAKSIIFVKKRYTARLLGEVLRKIGPPNLRLGLLIGTRNGDPGDMKFSFREQVLTIRRFRNGDLNCLIATSIAEEGLDIPDCNLVIRFDLYDTLIQYIQSRGRARHPASKYVHMCEANNTWHKQSIQLVREGEAKMRQFCEALPEDRLLEGNNCSLEGAVAKERGHRKFIIPETGAKLTYPSSLVVLAHFIGCLPRPADDIQQALYNVSIENRNFVCEVILPEASPLHSATGLPYSRKSTAKTVGGI